MGVFINLLAENENEKLVFEGHCCAWQYESSQVLFFAAYYRYAFHRLCARRKPSIQSSQLGKTVVYP